MTPRALALLALVPLAAASAPRRTERAPSTPRLVSAPSRATEAMRRLEAIRVRQIFGDDWDEVLVETADLDGVVRRHGGTWRRHGLGNDALRAPAGSRKLDWYLELWADPGVRRVEPNPRAAHPACRQMSIDILESGAGRMGDLTRQATLSLASAEGGLDAGGVTVGVVDSGVAPLAELQAATLPLIDVLHPRGPVVRTDADDLSDMALDAHGHGTAMASLVSAIARGALIQPVRVVDEDCDGNAFDLASGMQAAADAGARVVLVSMSTPHDSPTLRRTVARLVDAGVLVVAAAGNSGEVEFPGAYPGVVAVTAVDALGLVPDFAPRGLRVDLAAPGVGIVARGPTSDVRMTGTSPAAALAAGAAARLVLLRPDARPQDWAAILRWSTRAGAPGADGPGPGILDLEPLR